MGVIELSRFDEPNAFHIAFGADDALFVKHDEATAWLILLINMGNKCQAVTTTFLVWDQLFRITLKYVKVLQASYSQYCLYIIKYFLCGQ